MLHLLRLASLLPVPMKMWRPRPVRCWGLISRPVLISILNIAVTNENGAFNERCLCYTL